MRCSSLHVCLSTLLVLTACDGSASVTFRTGAIAFELSAAELALPTELRDGETDPPSIASIPCGPSGECPSSEEVVISCQADLCVPEPRTLEWPVGGVLDLDEAVSELSEVVRRVDRFIILDVTYEVTASTLTVPLDEVEVFFGPADANAIDPGLGVVRLGVIPPIAAGAGARGEMDLDPDGVEALSVHLVERSRQVRFFARTVVSLGPGDPFPAGALEGNVNLRARAEGSVID